MGHVDDLHDPKDKGQPQTEEGIIPSFQKAGEHGLDDGGVGDQEFLNVS